MNVLISRKGALGLYVDSSLVATWDAKTPEVDEQLKKRGLSDVPTVLLRGEGFRPELTDQEKYRISKKTRNYS